MKLHKVFEVGLAAALGAFVCWIIATTLGEPTLTKALFAVLGGMAGAFISVRPWEVAVALWEGIRIGMTREEIAGVFIRAKIVAAVVTAVVAACAVVLTSLAPLFVPLYRLSYESVPERVAKLGESGFTAEFSIMFVFVSFSALIAYVSYMGSKNGTVASKTLSGRFVRLTERSVDGYITKSFSLIEGKPSSWGIITVGLRFGVAITATVYLGAFSLILTPFFIARAVLIGLVNLILALAVTMRLAAMEGAATGGAMCLFLFWGKTDAFLLPAAAFMVTGGAIGMAVYALRSWLETKRGKWYVPLFFSELKAHV